jgi:hypothetical protein
LVIQQAVAARWLTTAEEKVLVFSGGITDIARISFL